MPNPNPTAIQARQRRLREQLFPGVSDHQLWDRRTRTGFATVPRALPLVAAIMDGLSPKKPLSATYLALWCRSWDDPMISLGSKLTELALEAGFGGQRAQNSMFSRLAILQELGFVRFAPGAGGQYSYALLLNPYQILMLHRAKIADQNWNALLGRMMEIGADDLDPVLAPSAVQPTETASAQPARVGTPQVAINFDALIAKTAKVEMPTKPKLPARKLPI